MRPVLKRVRKAWQSMREETRGLYIVAFLFVISLTVSLTLTASRAKPATAIADLILLVSAALGAHLLERIFLWRSLFRHNQAALQRVLDRTSDILRSTSQLGIQQIYPSREDAKKDVKTMIADASDRILLLGVAFATKITLDDTIPLALLSEKASKGVKVRILLLDPLRSTALFRALLESRREDLRPIIAPSPSPGWLRFFDTELYNNVQATALKLKRHPRLKVRFYGHAPICWLVVCDNIAMYEPYTLARAKEQASADLSIGARMPLMKVEKQESPCMFDTLVDHFDTIWKTSDTSAVHGHARVGDGERILRKIIESRAGWLKHVVNALEHWDDEPRGDVRTSCHDSPERLQAEWSEGVKPVACPAKIVDFSSSGLGLRLELPGATGLVEGIEVNLRNFRTCSTKEGQYIVDSLVDRIRYKVVWFHKDSQRVGLRRY